MEETMLTGMRTHAIVALAVIALALPALVGATGSAMQPVSSPGDVELHNLEHVFNFDPREHDPGWSPRAGSDLEFFTHTVPLRDYETGQFVDADGDPTTEPVIAERDFAVMGSFQRGGYVFDITDPEDTQFVSQVTCRQDRNDVAIRKFTDEETGETRVVLALTQQTGIPCADQDGGPGVQVNEPAELAEFIPANQWTGTADVADETAELVYAGTGCTPASYATRDVAGKIAIVVEEQDEDPTDVCPIATFFQKMQSAEAAGAIGLISVRRDDERDGRTAVASGIPGLELRNSEGMPLVEAVLDDETVNVTLTEEVLPGFEIIGEGTGGIGVFDITDPYDWEPMYLLRTGFGGVHNFAFHPTDDVGYAWTGALPGGIDTIPIVDFRDLDAPVVRAGPDTLGGPHDGELSPDGDRMYVASENNYQIYDSTDPFDPQLISMTPNVGSYAHGVFPSSDLELMITNNESLALGGFFAEGTGVCPGEGLAAYDISSEQAPIGPLGYYAPNVVGQTDARPCTSHFGRFAPDTKIMSIGWYVAGTRIVDWSDPSNPVEVAGAVLEGTNTWAAKFNHKGPYVYAGDLGRGFDVFRWSGEGPAPWLAEDPDDPEAGVEVTCDNCPVEIRAGEEGTADVEVVNTGDGDDTYDITVDDVPDGWTVTAEPAEVAVEEGETAEVEVTIEVPRQARAGEYTFTVTATSENDPGVSDFTEVEVEVRKGPPSDAGPPSEPGPPDQSADGGEDGPQGVAARTAGVLPIGAGLLALLALLGTVTAVRRSVVSRSR